MLVNPYLRAGHGTYWVPSTPSSALFGTDIADYWFPVAQGGDIAFLYGVLKILIENGWIDDDFHPRTHDRRFDELEAQLQPICDWTSSKSSAGLPRASMEEFAELIRDAKNARARLEHGHHAARLRRAMPCR